MSRSHKKHPVTGWTCADSDKVGKVVDHRRYRAYARSRANLEHWDFIAPRSIKENPYDWPKDGKVYWTDVSNRKKMMRK